MLVFWAGTMVALYQRAHPTFDEWPRPRVPLPREATDEWQGIYSAGKKIGYAHNLRIPTAEGFRLENQALVKLDMLGAARVVRTRVSADTDPRSRLRRFTFELRSGTVEFSASGTASDRELEVVFHSGARPGRRLRIPLSAPVALPQMLDEILGQEKLETGKTFRYAIFDPVAAEPAAVELTVGPTERIDLADGSYSTFRVTEEFHGTVLHLWVDPRGRVLREEGPLGLTLLRETEAQATSESFESSGSLDLVSAAAIPAGRSIPSPRELRRLSLRLSGLPADRTLAFPPRQTLEGEILRIQREENESFQTFPLPEREDRFAKDLEPTAFLQSDDPELRSLVRKILADESDAARAARKMLRWVFENLEKVPTVSVPNALDVLRSRQGDCNEHAVLYAAMARAAGLPARVVAGTVYMPADDGEGAGAFYYHAWVEVWLGRWTAVDPTFGQFPADATHVKFLEGGPETHGGLLGFIGKIRMEVQDFG